MSTKVKSTKVRLTYLCPSYLEGVSRLFDVSGLLRDEMKFDSAHTRKRHRRISGSESVISIAVSPAIANTDAINLAFRRINHSMAVTGDKMRPKN